MGKESDKSDEVYEIKSIRLITSLEDGNANDGKGVNIQKGMLHGKNYTFEVTEYIGKPPKNKSEIKWELFYNDPDIGLSETTINGTGERITINMGQVDSCGCFLYFRAYIKDKKNSAVFKVWKHNRFRWFDRLLVEREIEDRILNPWKINQSNTSLCGMACIFYLFAKEQPEKYRKFCLDLFRKGISKCNNYTAKPTKELLDKKNNEKGLPEGSTKLSLADFITLAGVRNTENPSYKGGDEDFQAINWTPIMTKLCKELLEYNEVESNNAYNPIKYSENDGNKLAEIIDDINKQIIDGYKLILLIDSDLISKDDDNIANIFQLEYHWVVLESEIKKIQNLDGNGNIFYTFDFSVYSWGTNPFGKTKYLKKLININQFIRNYYGYIKCK